MRLPISYSDMRPSIRCHAPQLGEHTDQVPAELDYSPADIGALRGKKIIK
ncbi:MAG: hypothetical protein ABI831_19355 [Betaproteobacteria bacterium]